MEGTLDVTIETGNSNFHNFQPKKYITILLGLNQSKGEPFDVSFVAENLIIHHFQRKNGKFHYF